MTNQIDIIKFKSGKIYSSQSGKIFLCESVTEDAVTFRPSKLIIKKTGEIRFKGHTDTFKIVGKRGPQQKAVVYTWYVDRQQYKEFIFADSFCKIFLG